MFTTVVHILFVRLMSFTCNTRNFMAFFELILVSTMYVCC